jgi:hypothetical protein
LYIENNSEIAAIAVDCEAIIDYDPDDFTIKRYFDNTHTKPPVLVITVGEKKLLDNALHQFLAMQMFKDREWFEIATKMYPEEQFNISNFMIDMSTYRRQYMLVTNNKGERVVWCNFFCDGIPAYENFDWQHKALGGHGGGNCFFNFKVNLSTGKYYDVWVNSEA